MYNYLLIIIVVVVVFCCFVCLLVFFFSIGNKKNYDSPKPCALRPDKFKKKT